MKGIVLAVLVTFLSNTIAPHMGTLQVWSVSGTRTHQTLTPPTGLTTSSNPKLDSPSNEAVYTNPSSSTTQSSYDPEQRAKRVEKLSRYFDKKEAKIINDETEKVVDRLRPELPIEEREKLVEVFIKHVQPLTALRVVIAYGRLFVGIEDLFSPW